MEKKTEKITVSLSPEVIHLADQNWEKFGFKNRSELIDAAIREYISRDLLKEFTGELSQFYQKIERSEIKHLEEHLAKLSYKIAVEIAQMHLLMASITALSKRPAGQSGGPCEREQGVYLPGHRPKAQGAAPAGGRYGNGG